MKKLFYSSIPLALSILALIVLWKTFTIPNQDYYNGAKEYPFSKGNASGEIRTDISAQLEYFEQGYLDRNTEILDEFCKSLLSRDNILILGTMPGEIFSGYEAATELIESDWLYWGDVHFLMDQANISIHANTAWVSTIGYVEFDMSRLLVLPLRYSGVMVFEDSDWKFQQMQFQFDLDNLKILYVIIILLFSSIGFFIRSFIIVIKFLTKKNHPVEAS